MTLYPFVGGHEVEGRIVRVGSSIRNFAVGDRVGTGWFGHTDADCPGALAGNHNVSPTSQGTVVARHGGFADRVRIQGTWVFPLNDGIPVGEAGAMFCGGATVWIPIHKFASPTDRVGVVGIGGLGHLALKSARCWGCHVTGFTTRDSKRAEAEGFGAHDVVIGSEAEAIEARAGTLDLLITTMDASIDGDADIGMVGPHGRIHVMGAVMEPVPVGAFSLINAGEVDFRFARRQPLGHPGNGRFRRSTRDRSEDRALSDRVDQRSLRSPSCRQGEVPPDPGSSHRRGF